MATYFTKDPDGILDYTVDWTAWLAAAEAIDTATWIIPTGITHHLAGANDTSDDNTATVWLSGGTVGAKYAVTNRIVTDQGRSDDRTITVVVANR